MEKLGIIFFFMLKLRGRPLFSIHIPNKSNAFMSDTQTVTGARTLPSDTVLPSSLSASLSNTNSFVDGFTQNQHVSAPHVSFPSCILSSLSVTFPVAPCSYLKLTATAPVSSTSWCLRVSQPSPPSQRRSAPFLPRGSAPSARAPTAWPTAARSEAWHLW